MQRTITVPHDGAYEATPQSIGLHLYHELDREGLVRDGDYRVVGYVNDGGVATKYVLEFNAKPKPSGTPKKD